MRASWAQKHAWAKSLPPPRRSFDVLLSSIACAICTHAQSKALCVRSSPGYGRDSAPLQGLHPPARPHTPKRPYTSVQPRLPPLTPTNFPEFSLYNQNATFYPLTPPPHTSKTDLGKPTPIPCGRSLYPLRPRSNGRFSSSAAVGSKTPGINPPGHRQTPPTAAPPGAEIAPDESGRGNTPNRKGKRHDRRHSSSKQASRRNGPRRQETRPPQRPAPRRTANRNLRRQSRQRTQIDSRPPKLRYRSPSTNRHRRNRNTHPNRPRHSPTDPGPARTANRRNPGGANSTRTSAHPMNKTPAYLAYGEYQTNLEGQGFHRAKEALPANLPPGHKARLTNYQKMVPCPICTHEGACLTRWRDLETKQQRYSATCKRCAHTTEIPLATTTPTRK